MKNHPFDLHSFIQGRHQEPKNCLIFGNFGALNFGDEAILAGEIEQLSKIENLKVTVVAKYPTVVEKLHGVNTIYFLDILAILQGILSADFFLIGGGGLFCKSSSGIKGKLFQIYFILLFMLFPKIIGKKVYVIGIGIYRNMGRLLLLLSVLALKLADHITVRDKQSKIFLEENNIKNDLYIDNSYLMTLPTDVSSEEKQLQSFDQQNINIGLALKYCKTAEETDLLISAIVAFIEKHPTAHFWFYSLDSNPFVKSDLEFNTSLLEIIKKRKLATHCHLVSTNYHPKDLFATFKMMDFFIAMRLHSMIFCDRLGVNFFGITYDSKCSLFLESIGKIPQKVDQNLSFTLASLAISKKN